MSTSQTIKIKTVDIKILLPVTADIWLEHSSPSDEYFRIDFSLFF
jgi:hypothetical protein